MGGLPDEAHYALGTLTRLPVPPPRRVNRAVTGRALALGPIVGATLGLVSGIPLLLTDPDLMARLLSATLVVAAAAWLTRAIHWDGLADVADALGSGAAPERAREIMKRGDIGPFGVLALVFAVLVQALGLAQLPAGAPALAGWVLATALGRLALAVAAGPWSRPAGPGGLGAAVVGAVGPSRLLVAGAGTAAVAVVAIAAGLVDAPVGLLWAPLAALLAAGLLLRVAHRRIGGVTGDVLGAVTELATTAAILAMGLA